MYLFTEKNLRLKNLTKRNYFSIPRIIFEREDTRMSNETFYTSAELNFDVIGERVS